jgi:hypothetical protein
MRFAIVALALLSVPFAASAQPGAPAVTSASEPTTVSFVSGFSLGSDEVGPLAGGTLSAGITPWLSLEGAAGFAGRGPGINGVYALASAVFYVLPATSRLVPFATIGGGLYHANFDFGNSEMFGRLGVAVDTMMEFAEGYQTWLRFYDSSGSRLVQLPLPRQLPHFYANRMATLTLSENGRWGRRSFTDPATSIGGGAVIRLSDKVALRPDARALLVFNEDDTYAVGLVSVGIGFRF